MKFTHLTRYSISVLRGVNSSLFVFFFLSTLVTLVIAGPKFLHKFLLILILLVDIPLATTCDVCMPCCWATVHFISLCSDSQDISFSFFHLGTLFFSTYSPDKIFADKSLRWYPTAAWTLMRSGPVGHFRVLHLPAEIFAFALRHW